jgi:hypothetical protein
MSNDDSTTTTSGTAYVASSAPAYVATGETSVELYLDLVLGLIFFATAGLALRRIVAASRSAGGGGGGGGAETYVVTAFYSLIGATAALRSLWFLVPAGVWQPSYVPMAVYAFDDKTPAWVGAMLSELTVTAGSLTLFSIFCLILCYWADILKKYFHPGARRSLPMMTFLVIMGSLLALELLNVGFFLAGVYTTEGMILYNAVLLAVVSVVCVCEISIFSHRFRTVLKTLGAINQVSCVCACDCASARGSVCAWRDQLWHLSVGGSKTLATGITHMSTNSMVSSSFPNYSIGQHRQPSPTHCMDYSHR